MVPISSARPARILAAQCPHAHGDPHVSNPRTVARPSASRAKVTVVSRRIPHDPHRYSGRPHTPVSSSLTGPNRPRFNVCNAWRSSRRSTRRCAAPAGSVTAIRPDLPRRRRLIGSPPSCRSVQPLPADYQAGPPGRRCRPGWLKEWGRGVCSTSSTRLRGGPAPRRDSVPPGASRPWGDEQQGRRPWCSVPDFGTGPTENLGFGVGRRRASILDRATGRPDEAWSRRGRRAERSGGGRDGRCGCGWCRGFGSGGVPPVPLRQGHGTNFAPHSTPLGGWFQMVLPGCGCRRTFSLFGP